MRAAFRSFRERIQNEENLFEFLCASLRDLGEQANRDQPGKSSR